MKYLSDLYPKGTRAVILARGELGTMAGKTANSLILQGEIFEPVAVIDETKSGKTTKKFLPKAKRDIPIYKIFTETLKHKPRVLIIGVAPPGGKLSIEWRKDIILAMKNGLDVINGLHTFFNDDPEFARVAKENGVTIHDVRRPPTELRIFDGSIRKIKDKTKIVTLLRTDSSLGKRTATTELVREAKKRGIKAGWVATGQTGLMIGCDSGYALDHLPADYLAGMLEKAILDAADKGLELIFIEGQGAICHPAYSGIALTLLHGSQPDCLIMCHDPKREKLVYFDWPIAELNKEIKIVEKLTGNSRAKVVGIASCGAEGEREENIEIIKKITSLPAADVFLPGGAALLLDAILEYLKKKQKRLDK